MTNFIIRLRPVSWLHNAFLASRKIRATASCAFDELDIKFSQENVLLSGPELYSFVFIFFSSLGLYNKHTEIYQEKC